MAPLHQRGAGGRSRDALPTIAAVRTQMSELEFGEAIQRLNGVLQDYWPCNLCFYFGYLCCPCTLGLSFLGPRLCVSDVRAAYPPAITTLPDPPCAVRRLSACFREN